MRPGFRASWREAVGDAAEVLQAAEGVLDQVATPVSLPIVTDRAVAVATTGDDRDGSGLTQRAAQAVRVIALVAEQVAHPPSAFEQRGRGQATQQKLSLWREQLG